MTIRFLATSICAAGLACAQTTTTPAPATGPVGRRANGQNFVRGAGPGPGFGGRGGMFGPNAEARLTKQLGLDATQQNALHTALQSEQVQRKGMNQQAAALQTQLAKAVKAGDEGTIESVSKDLSALHEQQTTIHAKTLSAIYSSLNDTQKAKAEPMINRELGVAGPRQGPPRGRGGRGPRANGTQPANGAATATPQ